MTGSLFQNDKKEADNHPDFRGSALIDGVEYWQKGWRKKTKDGKYWLSQSFERKDKQRPGVNDEGRQESQQDSFSDDIPF